MANSPLKIGKWLLLAGCIVSGCASGPQPPKGVWPWERASDYENRHTGNYFSVSGNVANFGEAPKAADPITPESLELNIPEPQSASGTSVTKTYLPLLPTDSDPGSGKIARDYDFTVREVKIAPPSYLPVESVSAAYDITSFNRGSAPVSVTIGVDQALSRNIATDKTLPFNAVVPPNSDQVLVHFWPRMRNEAYNFRYTYSWSIGDYTASHNCPEHYKFPFGENIRAFAHVSDKTNSTPYSRNSVIFSLTVGTQVLAGRKGRVVQIKTDNQIDILHDDSTIATYGHLGKIAEGVVVGKTVSTDDIIGIVGPTGNKNEAYMQLTVWHPEPLPVASPNTDSPGPGFDLFSFPLEFCSTDTNECRVLTKDQMVSRNKIVEVKKQGKRKSKQGNRK